MADTYFLLILIVVAGAALLTAVVLAVGTSTRRVVWTSFWCPLKKRHVTVGFLADRFRRDRYCDVLACSAFAGPWRVSCDKRCLHLPEAYRAPTADEAPWASTQQQCQQARTQPADRESPASGADGWATRTGEPWDDEGLQDNGHVGRRV